MFPDMLSIFSDVLRNSVLITGLVVVMMMMIESLNIESKGLFFAGLKKTRFGQVIIAALLGTVPGCMGGFATVSLYTHGLFSFGALVAMMIASSGDEAFMILAMVPDKALLIFTILFVVAVAAGLLTDLVFSKGKMKIAPDVQACGDGYIVHDESKSGRHFTWKRFIMFAGLLCFIAALLFGIIGHDHAGHHHEECSHTAMEINLLDENWMNVLFAGLSLILGVVLIFGSDHFVEEHLWNHIVKKHLPVIFAWTFGVLAILTVCLHFLDISQWISDNTVLMILLATLVGIIPESGPHMIFVTLYASGIVPLPVLLASSVSQDGHSSIPLLAESKKGFLKAKLINCLVALSVGFISMIFV